MWVFYLMSLPLTLGMVAATLKYFAGPEVPRYVLFTVGYAWFCSLSIIILVSADSWTASDLWFTRVGRYLDRAIAFEKTSGGWRVAVKFSPDLSAHLLSFDQGFFSILDKILAVLQNSAW